MREERRDFIDRFREHLGAVSLGRVLKSAADKLNYEHHGGSPLLGVNGVSIMAHGSSSARPQDQNPTKQKPAWKGGSAFPAMSRGNS